MGYIVQSTEGFHCVWDAVGVEHLGDELVFYDGNGKQETVFNFEHVILWSEATDEEMETVADEW